MTCLVGIVLQRGGISGVQDSFIRAVVRRLGHPIRALGVYMSMFSTRGASRGSRGTLVVRAIERRDSGLATCLTGLQRMVETRRRVPLRVASFSVRTTLLGLITICQGGERGRIGISLSCRHASSEVVKSESRLLGIIDGLVRGSIGCSNSVIGVRITYQSARGRRIVVSMSSGKVKVSPSRRREI